MATVLDLESSPKLYLDPGQKWLHWEEDELKAGDANSFLTRRPKLV